MRYLLKKIRIKLTSYSLIPSLLLKLIKLLNKKQLEMI